MLSVKFLIPLFLFYAISFLFFTLFYLFYFSFLFTSFSISISFPLSLFFSSFSILLFLKTPKRNLPTRAWISWQKYYWGCDVTSPTPSVRPCFCPDNTCQNGFWYPVDKDLNFRRRQRHDESSVHYQRKFCNIWVQVILLTQQKV